MRGQRIVRDLQRQLGSIITQVRAGATGTTMVFFSQLLRLVLDKGMSVPGNIALALRSLGALEGTLKQINPSLDLIDTARDQARAILPPAMAVEVWATDREGRPVGHAGFV